MFIVLISQDFPTEQGNPKPPNRSSAPDFGFRRQVFVPSLSAVEVQIWPAVSVVCLPDVFSSAI